MRKLKAAVIALLTAGMLSAGALLAGCSSEPSPEEAIRASLDAELSVFENPTQEQIDELVADMGNMDEFAELGIDIDAYIKNMLEGFTYSIDSIEVAEDGKTAVGNVTISCKSFTAATDKFSELIEQWTQENAENMASMSEEQLNLEVGKILMRGMSETEPVNSSCSLDYELVDGTWTPADTAEAQLMKAFYA